MSRHRKECKKVPLKTVSSVVNQMVTERIRRQEHFRTIGIHAFPQPGVLPSEILKTALPKLTEFEKKLPQGYRMEIGGERAKQQVGLANLGTVLVISRLGIYAALLLQFGNAIKPLLVFAATPYGVVGALLCLALTGSPFGFMAFLGVASCDRWITFIILFRVHDRKTSRKGWNIEPSRTNTFPWAAITKGLL